ncbi:MAG: tRNA 2-thiouridine(34) synthase MnmA [Synergistaceae bacterium]|nr:tRNA 2-thiouridine(34) synthase MnmA [Synergistaceae bacterium]
MKIFLSNPLSPPFPPVGDRRAVALMSGGVDSSVAARILIKEGWKVAGLTMVIPGQGGPGGPVVRSAAEAARTLSIPHYVADLEDDFRELVIDPFIAEYRAGKTPNPCARCNATLKLGRVWDAAEEAFGAVALATGHYAQIISAGGRAALARGADWNKDQSYFLYGIKRERLPRLLLPLGGLDKQSVRAMAREAGLEAAEKGDSMDICFDAGEGYRKLLGNGEGERGEIVDEEGRVLGFHDGVWNFTIGQKKGLGAASRGGLCVLEIDGEENRVVVGPRERALSRVVEAEEVNILLPDLLAKGADLFGKTRSRGEPAPLKITRLREGRMQVLFDEPQFAPAPGQRLVIYDGGGLVAGGGVIARGSGEPSCPG